MFASFLITLREGLEAFLLVGICLSYLAKLGASRYNKFIYLGVGLGLVAVGEADADQQEGFQPLAQGNEKTCEHQY
jgi:FTR1 family protein